MRLSCDESLQLSNSLLHFGEADWSVLKICSTSLKVAWGLSVCRSAKFRKVEEACVGMMQDVTCSR